MEINDARRRGRRWWCNHRPFSASYLFSSKGFSGKSFVCVSHPLETTRVFYSVQTKKASERSWFYCFNFCTTHFNSDCFACTGGGWIGMRVASCSGTRVDFQQEIVSLLYPQLINQTRPICILKEGRCKLCSHAKPPISLQNVGILIVKTRGLLNLGTSARFRREITFGTSSPYHV